MAAAGERGTVVEKLVMTAEDEREDEATPCEPETVV